MTYNAPFDLIALLCIIGRNLHYCVGLNAVLVPYKLHNAKKSIWGFPDASDAGRHGVLINSNKLA